MQKKVLLPKKDSVITISKTQKNMEVIYKDPRKLKPNPINLQIHGDEQNEDFYRMVENIRVNNILQPLSITANDGVRSGELRRKAAIYLGLTKVPCIVESDSEQLYNIEETKNSAETIERFKTASNNLRRRETPHAILCEIKALEEYYNIKKGVRTDRSPELQNAKATINQMASETKKAKLRSIQNCLEIIYPNDAKKQTEYWKKVGAKISIHGAYKETKVLAVKSSRPKDLKQKLDYITDQIKIYNQSCLDLSVIPSKSITAIVTSPPYFKMRPEQEGLTNEIGREASVDLYVKNLVEIFKNCREKVLKDNAVLWVNLSDSVKDGEYTLAPERFLLAMVDAGFHVNDIVLWIKSNAQYCAGDRSTRNYEFLFHFTVSKKFHHDQTWLNDVKGFEESVFGAGTRIKLAAFLQLREGIVKTPSANTERLREACKREGFYLEHSSTYPVEIPYLCIKSSCTGNGDEHILDIFNGCGNTARAMLATKMPIKYTGLEITADYVKASKVNIEMATKPNILIVLPKPKSEKTKKAA